MSISTNIIRIGLKFHSIEIRDLRNFDFNLSVSALSPLTSSNKQTNRGFSHTKYSDIIVHSATSYICENSSLSKDICRIFERMKSDCSWTPDVYSVDLF